MKLLRAIFHLFWNLSTAREIKKDPERRKHSFYFAIKSIACVITAVICVALMGVMSFMDDGMAALLFIFWIAIFAMGAVGAVISILAAICNWFFQLYINRGVMTWVSLVILLAGLVGAYFVADGVGGLF